MHLRTVLLGVCALLVLSSCGSDDSGVVGRSSHAVLDEYSNQGFLEIGCTSASCIDDVVALDWGDVDKDGDLDLAVAWGPPGQPVEVFENQGASFASYWTSSVAGPAADLAWGDYDKDGNLDLAVSTIGGHSTTVYKNDGVTLSVVFTSSTYQPESSGLAWGDWDGDGDLDLGEANLSGWNVIYENVADSNPGAPFVENTQGSAWVFAEDHLSAGIAFGDFDGGGGVKVVFGGAVVNCNDCGADDDKCVVWEYPAATAHSSIYECQDIAVTDVAFGDVDADGILNVAASSDGGLVRIFGNKTSTGWTNDWESAEAKDAWALALGDSDGQGVLDLAISLASESESVPTESLELFDFDAAEDIGIGSQHDGYPIWSEMEAPSLDLAFAHVDQDGHLDLAVALVGEPIRIYWGGAAFVGMDGLLVKWEDDSSSALDAARSVDWGDWDGDGDLDLAVGRYSQSTEVFGNVAGDLSLVFSTGGFQGAVNAVSWGDWDGDGDLDLALGLEGWADQIFENNGNGSMLSSWNAAQDVGNQCTY